MHSDLLIPGRKNCAPFAHPIHDMRM